MSKPAPYLTHPSCPYQLEILRFRTQHTIRIIPKISAHRYLKSKKIEANRASSKATKLFLRKYQKQNQSTSHLHYAFRNPRADYQDRTWPYYLATGTTILGDELHIIFHCPATKGVLDKSVAKFRGPQDYLTFPPLMTWMVLGNPPPLRNHWGGVCWVECGVMRLLERM